MSDRRYAMTMIAPGDWLLLSNDGKTLWRIRLYEDGPTHGLEIPADRDYWGVWKWLGNLNEGYVVDPQQPDQWDFFEGSHHTRRDAVNAALRLKGTEST